MTAHTETSAEHVRNALAILVLSHDADDVEAACSRLQKALRQIDADKAEHTRLVEAVRTLRRAVSTHFMARGLDAIDARRRTA